MPEDSGQEKTHEPTPERYKKAYEEGVFAFSREVVTAISFLGSLLWLACAHQSMRTACEDCLREFFAFTRYEEIDISSLGPLCLIALRYAARIAGPLLALALVLGLAANVFQSGFHYASKKKMFDMSRLDPAAGFQRLFSASHLFEGAKAVLKAALFAVVCYWTVHSARNRILVLGAMPPLGALESSIRIALAIIFRAGILMIVFSVIDYAFQRWQHRKKLMMTYQELKEEHKEMEGDPTHRRRLRARQMELSRHRMISAVRTSDVVVTNPTQYAVALKYEAQKGGAPRLVAKGARLLAERIREEARRHQVPIVEDRFVARTIYFGVKLGQEIPYTLYRAVAEILAYVYHVTGKIPRRPKRPRPATA